MTAVRELRLSIMGKRLAYKQEKTDSRLPTSARQAADDHAVQSITRYPGPSERDGSGEGGGIVLVDAREVEYLVDMLSMIHYMLNVLSYETRALMWHRHTATSVLRRNTYGDEGFVHRSTSPHSDMTRATVYQHSPAAKTSTWETYQST
ncbi:hypothetical protein Tco_1365277 [Tanacetum coccineum]